MISELGSSMDTRGKTNAKFRTEVNHILANHESRFDKILSELQALRLQQNQPTSPQTHPTIDINSMHKAKHLSTKPPHNLQYPTKPSHKLQYSTKHNLNYHFPNSRVKTPTDGYTNANRNLNLRESFHNSEFN